MKKTFKYILILAIGICSISSLIGKTDAYTAAASEMPKTVKSQKERDILVFRDVFGQEYKTWINPKIKKNRLDYTGFKHVGNKLEFNDDAFDYMLGVDVSEHQGYIDWNSVKNDGYDFAFLRIGYRGYGQSGIIKKDYEFERNLENAKKVGILVGVYFFAQAVNEKEAAEEAQNVLTWLGGRSLDLPVVYDPESILDDEARTDGVSGVQFTKNSLEFCKLIKEGGYKPMIYANMLWEAFELDLVALSDYPIWYADYEAVPQTPYRFKCWQYSNTGKVSGINGDADLDVWIKRVR